jgi:hypothetical protein
LAEVSRESPARLRSRASRSITSRISTINGSLFTTSHRTAQGPASSRAPWGRAILACNPGSRQVGECPTSPGHPPDSTVRRGEGDPDSAAGSEGSSQRRRFQKGRAPVQAAWVPALGVELAPALVPRRPHLPPEARRRSPQILARLSQAERPRHHPLHHRRNSLQTVHGDSRCVT